MSIDSNKINALVTLLGDSDMEVMEIAEREILTLGKEVISHLEDSYLLIESNQQKDKLDSIINQLKSEKVHTALSAWVNSEKQDLLEAWFIISEVSGRAINKEQITKEIEQLKVEIWLGLQSDQSVIEKINYFNHIFYTKRGFEGDTKDYTHPSNSYIDTVVQNKKGNPIALSSLYLILARKLRLPVYGVNLPQHFVLAFMSLDIDRMDVEDIVKLGKGEEINFPVDLEKDPLFYINPFNKGTIFSKKHLISFLKELKIVPEEKFYGVCSSKDMVLRMLRNLQASFAKSHNVYKKEEVDKLIDLLDHV